MKVQVIFKNNLQIEGKISSFIDNKMIIESEDGLLTTIIPSVSDSVVFYQIHKSRDEYDRLKYKADKNDKDLQNIVNAKIRINQEERREIAKKLQEPINELYSTKQSSSEYTKEKIRRTNIPFTENLQKLFK